MVQDEGEQQAVALIRGLHQAGGSLRQIAREVEARGFRTKTGKADWHPETVAAVLKRIERDEKEKAA